MGNYFKNINMARTKMTARKSAGGKHPKSTLPPRPPPRRLPVVSREPTDSDPAQLPSEKSESSRNPLSSSSASSPSRDSSEISPETSRTTLDSSLPPSSPSMKPPRPTWSDFSKTPTSAPSTPRESPSCPRTCSSPAESVERDLEQFCSSLLVLLNTLYF